jgi:hypothetical protein
MKNLRSNSVPAPKYGHILISNLIILLLLISILYSTNNIKAKEQYVDYVPGPLNGKCEACHSGNSLDAYGEDFGSISGHSSDPQRAINLISNMDSDGDGFMNSQELSKGTFPGDPESYPKSSKDDEIDIIPFAAMGLLFFIMIVVILMYNNGYISINRKQDKNVGKKNKKDKRDISIADDRKNQGLKAALKNLDKDYMSGTLDVDVYHELKRIYENKIYK